MPEGAADCLGKGGLAWGWGGVGEEGKRLGGGMWWDGDVEEGEEGCVWSLGEEDVSVEMID